MADALCEKITDVWCLENQVDTAAIAGESVDPTLGVTRVRDPRLGVAWRTPIGGGSITISMSNAVPIEVFGIFGLSESTATFELDMGSAPGLSDIRSGPWVPNIDPLIKQGLWMNIRDLQLDPMPSVAEIVLTVTPAVATNSVDIGRIWAADYHWTPCVSHSYAANQPWYDTSTKQRSLRSGAVFADKSVVQRGHDLVYDSVNKSEWDGPLFSLQRLAGTARQVLFIPNYEIYPPERHAICGYSEQLSPIAAIGFDRFSQPFSLREAG